VWKLQLEFLTTVNSNHVSSPYAAVSQYPMQGFNLGLLLAVSQKRSALPSDSWTSCYKIKSTSFLSENAFSGQASSAEVAKLTYSTVQPQDALRVISFVTGEAGINPRRWALASQHKYHLVVKWFLFSSTSLVITTANKQRPMKIQDLQMQTSRDLSRISRDLTTVYAVYMTTTELTKDKLSTGWLTSRLSCTLSFSLEK